MEPIFRDPRLIPIWEKLQTGCRLNPADGVTLFASTDLLALGKMARWVKYEKSGDGVYYALNLKIEPSNICRLHCKICAFSRRPGEAEGYDLSIEEALSRISPGIREVHITGSLHPGRPFNYYLDLVAAIRKAHPSVGIKAYTAVEIDHFRKAFRIPVREILGRLKEAGLDSLPGGGAEVFSERIRRRLFPGKIGHKRWLAIHRMAHRLGIPTNATMLYGHLETYEERLGHLLALRDLQDETGGFISFIPLPFQSGTTGIRPSGGGPSAVDDLKTVAVSRLILDNIPHIKAYWVMMTPEGAALALSFGADDLDGTVGGERIAHAAGAETPRELTESRIIEIIREAGLVAVERDVFYNPLKIVPGEVVGKIPYLNSVPFYRHFPKGRYPVLPLAPRHMGILSRRGQIMAGPFSLVDFLGQRNRLESLDFCIASPAWAGSVLLFSRRPPGRLEGGVIGITDDTATSVKLLEVLLEKRFRIEAKLSRLAPAQRDFRNYSGLLFIGDEALRRKKLGMPGFPHVMDLAKEWNDWQGLPFVFAVWAVRRDLPGRVKRDLQRTLERSLQKGERELADPKTLYPLRGALDPSEASCYLSAFRYRLGDRERAAIELFERLLHE